MTRDNMLEGDSGASGWPAGSGRVRPAAAAAAHPAARTRRLQLRGDRRAGRRGRRRRRGGHLWKLVRTFDDPATWTEPASATSRRTAPGGPSIGASPSPTSGSSTTSTPMRRDGQPWRRPADARCSLTCAPAQGGAGRLGPRAQPPWPYATRRPRARRRSRRRPRPAPAAPALRRVGMHPEDPAADPTFDLAGRRALVISTNHGVLDIGKATGVFASEMTVPYYAFLDAGMDVDVASPLGGVVPVDPQSLKPVLRARPTTGSWPTTCCGQGGHSLAVGEVDMATTTSSTSPAAGVRPSTSASPRSSARRSPRPTRAARRSAGCATGRSGCATPPRRRPTARRGAQDLGGHRQAGARAGDRVHPAHPETELRGHGRGVRERDRFHDPFANHWVVDGNLVTGQNQNAGPMVAREMMRLVEAGDGNHTTAEEAAR